jgi:hypothetical protein
VNKQTAKAVVDGNPLSETQPEFKLGPPATASQATPPAAALANGDKAARRKPIPTKPALKVLTNFTRALVNLDTEDERQWIIQSLATLFPPPAEGTVTT